MPPTKCILPGCDNAARPGGSTCSAAHRSALHRYRKATANALTPRERKRLRDRERARVKRAAGVPAMDIRLQWERAVEVLAATIQFDRAMKQATNPSAVQLYGHSPREHAVNVLKPALPEHLRDLV